MSDKQKSEKVSALCYAPSKWYQWLALNVELEKVELISTSTRLIVIVKFIILIIW